MKYKEDAEEYKNSLSVNKDLETKIVSQQSLGDCPKQIMTLRLFFDSQKVANWSQFNTFENISVT